MILEEICNWKRNRLESILMDQVFQRMMDRNFSDLAGTVINASIPVPQHLINEFIEEVALQGNKTIVSCTVAIHGQNRASANVRTTLLPWPFAVRMKLDRTVDFASYSSPKLRAWLENNRLLGGLGSFLNMLPEGVKLYGNQIVFDLGVFLTSEQKQMLDFVKSVEIRTEEGKLIFDLRIEIN